MFTAVAIVAGLAMFGITRYANTRPTASPKNIQVALLADRGEPSVISIKRGNAIVFNTKDDKVHNIGQGSGKDETTHEGEDHSRDDKNKEGHEHFRDGKDSGPFGKGQAYQVTFDKVGTYTFHDHLNPKINITVVVYEPDNS